MTQGYSVTFMSLEAHARAFSHIIVIKTAKVSFIWQEDEMSERGETCTFNQNDGNTYTPI